MKNILVPFFIFLSYTVSAQITERDGIYYTDKGLKYTGTYIEYFENGSKKIEIPINDGLKNGNIFLYFENGKTSEIRSYKLNQMHGTWEKWNKTGVKISEANYIDDKKHGRWIIWDDNGTMRYEMFYNNGKKTGKWTIWDENSIVKAIKEFEE